MAAFPLPNYVLETENAIVKVAKEILGPNPRPARKDWEAARTLAIEELRKRGVLRD